MKLQSLLLAVLVGAASINAEGPTPTDINKEKKLALTALVLEKYYEARPSNPTSFESYGQKETFKLGGNEYEKQTEDGCVIFTYKSDSNDTLAMVRAADESDLSYELSFNPMIKLKLKDRHTECKIQTRHDDPLNLSNAHCDCFILIFKESREGNAIIKPEANALIKSIEDKHKKPNN